MPCTPRFLAPAVIGSAGAGLLVEPCGQLAKGAVDLRGAESLRSIMDLCGLIKTHSASAISGACLKALKVGTYRFKDLWPYSTSNLSKNLTPSLTIIHSLTI
jgi:hypothetical protein